MEKIVLGPIVGALAGLLVSLAVLPFGIHRAEWFMTVGAALGLFVGLMMIDEGDKGHSFGVTGNGREEGKEGRGAEDSRYSRLAVGETFRRNEQKTPTV